MSEIVRVKLKIYSHIDNLDSAGLPEGDPEITESTYDSTLNTDGEDVTLSYEEKQEGSEAVACSVLGRNGKIYVTRSGAICSEMIFEQGASHTSLYKIPPYSFDMKITTRRIRGVLAMGETLELIYSMEIGGAKKDCRMRISIHAAGGTPV